MSMCLVTRFEAKGYSFLQYSQYYITDDYADLQFQVAEKIVVF